ncbi:MAG: ribonucleoside-triphosphate reductase [Acidimicrobiales bacterium]
MMSNLLPTDYQTFIATSRYARWLEEEGRRETWGETVSRYMDNIVKPVAGDDTYINNIEQAILSLEVMPSMRSMMTAGKAANRDNTCMYNCSYLAVDDPKAFDEAMFILLCGTGVGFSVERQYINSLPEIPQLFYSDTIVMVRDSKEGWAKAFRQVLALLWAGEIPKWNVEKVRPAGARLKTFGGRASGPAPLVDLFNFAVTTFKNAQGRKLSSIEAHDLMCKVGEVVVVGGVRRSAMISLSNLSDDRMRHAKSGKWWENDPQRALANNSVAYSEKPDSMSFMREWTALVESGSGERGIFNRQAAIKQAAKNGRRDPNREWGTNPCSEIILAGPRTDPKTGNPIAGTGGQFCNLSEVVVRATDSIEDLERKVRLATILGTVQATYTKFPYLRKVWEKNTAEERLLGVSLTGIMDNPLMTTANNGLAKTLEHLKQVAVDTNKEWADRLGVEQSAAITCVKPSGTVSQLVDSASGIHARHSPYYIRTVRGDNKDPLTQFMIDQGIPNEPEAFKPDQTTVFSFPVKSPAGAVCTANLTAIEQLEMWLMYQRHWCEHKPSVTVNVKADEWFEVGAFVYENFDEMSGVSFLPYDDHTYQQAPYQECDVSKYQMLLGKMPERIDWSKLADYEKEDTTVSMQTMACTGDSCELVDISA